MSRLEAQRPHNIAWLKQPTSASKEAMMFLFNWLKENTDFDQLIWEFGTDNEPSWVHVSYSPRHRKQILKAVKQNGRTKYLNF
jgi:hypothetical protein